MKEIVYLCYLKESLVLDKLSKESRLSDLHWSSVERAWLSVSQVLARNESFSHFIGNCRLVLRSLMTCKKLMLPIFRFNKRIQKRDKPAPLTVAKVRFSSKTSQYPASAVLTNQLDQGLTTLLLSSLMHG